MGKSRKVVPAALHTELSEYASLMRALKTSETLDLTSQLTRAQSRASTSQQGLNETDNGEDGRGRTAITSSVFSSSRAQVGSRKAKAKDNWTRWPLLDGDVHNPEFGFEEEIKLIASEALQLFRKDTSDKNVISEDEEENLLPQSFLDSLTHSSSSHLSQILSALAAHVPLTEKSMQNRVKPIGWEAVLDIVAVGRIVEPKFVFNSCNIYLYSPYFSSCNRIIEGVQRRMERIYDMSGRPSSLQ
jgi:hypothetical protein